MILSEFRLNEDDFYWELKGECVYAVVYQAKIKLEKFERSCFERKNVQPRLFNNVVLICKSFLDKQNLGNGSQSQFIPADCHEANKPCIVYGVPFD